MATVTGPLIGIDAHGQFGHQVIYQGNVVRGYFKPTNTRSQAQQDNRSLFKLAKGAITIIKPSTRSILYTNAPDPSHWPARLIGLMLGSQHNTINATIAAFNALPASDQNTWTSYADIAMLPRLIGSPEDASPLDRGILLYALSHAVHNDNTPGAPAAAPSIANLNEWCAFLFDFTNPVFVLDVLTLAGQPLQIGGELLTLSIAGLLTFNGQAITIGGQLLTLTPADALALKGNTLTLNSQLLIL